MAQLIFRPATRADLPTILDLLENDEISRSRETNPPPTTFPTTTPPPSTPPPATSPTTASPAAASPTAATPATSSPATSSPATASPGTASPATASPTAASPATDLAAVSSASARPSVTSTPAVETPEAIDATYWSAFEAIDADPRNELIVAEESGKVVGTCQLTFTPSLSRRGTERMTIEAVRVHTDLRGRGVGRAMMQWSLDRARERGCRLAQLTTDKRRTDAHRFYASLGFEPSHEGFKLAL